ncbi:NRDE-2, necessary for RNA interference-domain-containing protein [Xylaria flabelliformis]|nr:NRDE-2, necessary for RNA interference-domain-containing protein [Xylaria flabelliformis]
MSSSHEKERKSTVPKFGSFKPKTPDVISPAVETAGNQSKRNDYRIATASDSQAHRRLAVDEHATSRSVSRRPKERESDENVLYCLDKRGDALISRYGSNDRSRIPEYRRIGGGRVLPAEGFMKIERLGNRQEFFMRSYHESGSLLSSDKKNLMTRGIRPDSQAIRIRQGISGGDAATDDHISFKTSRKRKRDGSAPEESSGDEGPSYRSINGMSKKNEHSDSDEEYESDASEDALNRKSSDPISKRSIELSRKVREHPEDVDSWLELVDHQDILLDLQSGSRAPTAAEIKSFADIKLSMLEQALLHASDDGHRERLNLEIIKEGLKVWELKAALKRLKEMMQKYPNSFELWKLYISFSQSTLSACRYDEIKQLYSRKLQSLRKELLGPSTVETQIKYSGQMIYVFLRLTRFLADAGYAELASAAWQATLELNLVRPSTPSSQTELEIPSSFQEYWESEIPRLGEDNWQGWTKFVTDAAAQNPPDPIISNPPAPPTTRDGYKAWHTVEHHRAQNATTPARTLDEGAEDDPFRVVMFTDFQDILLYFPTEVVSQLRPQLLDAFLIFCRLPPSLQIGEIVDMNDSFLIRGAQNVPFPHLSSRNNMDLHEDQQSRPPEFSHSIKQMSLTSEVLFPSAKWFGYFEQIHGKVPSESYRWVATTLKQLTRVVGIKELSPYALALESLNEPGNEKKSAKALLKQDPFNVDLYIGYSILEHERQNGTAARNVLSAALGLSSIPPHDRVRLHIGAAWLELDDGDLAKAALQLCQSVENGPNTAQATDPTEATSSQILKAKQFLVTNRDYKVSSGDISQAVIYAEGLVLLDYLTQRSEKEPSSPKQGDIYSAIQRITQFSSDLVSRDQQHNPSHEIFLQFCARLLYYHARHGSFRPSLLRDQLTQYLTYFPRNTIFLTLFAWREERLSINDRVRTLLQDTILTRKNESLSSHIFAISHELRTGNAHSTRAAFERALSSTVCAHHVGLWIAYIRFCHARKELRAKFSKGVFYRAVQACPWSKDVFMEAFGTLVREMDSAELRSVYSTMCEKGLRVHVDMDEFVEKWRREQKGGDGERGG